MIATYLLGTGSLAADPAALAHLHAGAHLTLRRTHCIEVCAPDGCALGYLPSDEAHLVAALMDTGAAVTARVTAVVPAFWRPRVQLQIGAETKHQS